MSEEWEATFNIIKGLHDKAYETIDEAIKFEEDSQPSMVIFFKNKLLNLFPTINQKLKLQGSSKIQRRYTNH